jgi:hypothetical protein
MHPQTLRAFQVEYSAWSNFLSRYLFQPFCEDYLHKYPYPADVFVVLAGQCKTIDVVCSRRPIPVMPKDFASASSMLARGVASHLHWTCLRIANCEGLVPTLRIELPAGRLSINSLKLQ